MLLLRIYLLKHKGDPVQKRYEMTFNNNRSPTTIRGDDRLKYYKISPADLGIRYKKGVEFNIPLLMQNKQMTDTVLQIIFNSLRQTF